MVTLVRTQTVHMRADDFASEYGAVLGLGSTVQFRLQQVYDLGFFADHNLVAVQTRSAIIEGFDPVERMVTLRVWIAFDFCKPGKWN